MLEYVILTIIGYLIGGLSPSYFIAKYKGFNIKEKGSKNCGASNAYITMGIKVAVIVYLLDFFKVFIAVLIALPFFKQIPYFHLVVGFSCIFGHMFPFYLKFKGGKGFSCLIACMILINPIFALITLVVAMGLALITNYIVVATFIVVIATSIYLPITTNLAILPTIYCLISTTIIFVKHIPNFIKIIKKEEYHIFKDKTKQKEQKEEEK